VLEHVSGGNRDGFATDDEVRHRKGAEEADGVEDGGELTHKPRGIAVGGEQFEVNDAQKEDAVKNAELKYGRSPVSTHG
jgi:hypothetical protein